MDVVDVRVFPLITNIKYESFCNGTYFFFLGLFPLFWSRHAYWISIYEWVREKNMYVKSFQEIIFIPILNHKSEILVTALTPSKWWMVMARLCTASSITSQIRASAPSPGRRQTRWPRVTRTMPSGILESMWCDEANIVIIRDLYNAIASEDFPTWTMFIQVMTFKQAENWEFNPFDLTKVKFGKIVLFVKVTKVVSSLNIETSN